MSVLNPSGSAWLSNGAAHTVFSRLLLRWSGRAQAHHHQRAFGGIRHHAARHRAFGEDIWRLALRAAVSRNQHLAFIAIKGAGLGRATLPQNAHLRSRPRGALRTGEALWAGHAVIARIALRTGWAGRALVAL